MKIKSIKEVTHHIVETYENDCPSYRRFGDDDWTNLVSDEWDVLSNTKELELLFQGYDKKLPSILEKYCINSEFYPLTLDKELKICMWQEDNSRYTIAIFELTKEGYALRFIGDRPIDEPDLNWSHFEQLIRQGQILADARFDEKEND